MTVHYKAIGGGLTKNFTQSLGPFLGPLPRCRAGGPWHFPQPQLRPSALREDQALPAQQQRVLRPAGAGANGDGEAELLEASAHGFTEKVGS